MKVIRLEQLRVDAQACFPHAPRGYYTGPALYIYLIAGRVMYVGITSNLTRRNLQHLFAKKDNLRKRVSCKYWWCMWWEVHDVELLAEIEKRVIQRLKPVYNVMHM